jgi:hypothetical protein
MSSLRELQLAAQQALAQPPVPSSGEAEQVAADGRALAGTWVPEVQLAGGTVYRLSTVAAHLHRLNGRPSTPCLVWVDDHRPSDRLVTIGEVAYYLDEVHGSRHLYELDPHDLRTVLDAGQQAEREGWLEVRSVNDQATMEMLAAELADRTQWLRARDPLGQAITAAAAAVPGEAAGYTAVLLALVRYAAAAWPQMTEAQRATLLVLLDDGLPLFEAIDAAFALGA